MKRKKQVLEFRPEYNVGDSNRKAITILTQARTLFLYEACGN